MDARPAAALLGYLNFSDGRPDPRFQAALDEAFAAAADRPAPWTAVRDRLKAAAGDLRGGSAAFRDTTQAEFVLDAAFGDLPPAYREHHRDLLFHQTDLVLFNSFFLARCCEAVLAEGGPWEEGRRRRVVTGALAAAERLRRPPARRPAGDPAADRSVSARAAAAGAGVPPRRRGGVRPVRGS